MSLKKLLVASSIVTSLAGCGSDTMTTPPRTVTYVVSTADIPIPTAAGATGSPAPAARRPSRS